MNKLFPFNFIQFILFIMLTLTCCLRYFFQSNNKLSFLWFISSWTKIKNVNKLSIQPFQIPKLTINKWSRNNIKTQEIYYSQSFAILDWNIVEKFSLHRFFFVLKYALKQFVSQWGLVFKKIELLPSYLYRSG